MVVCAPVVSTLLLAYLKVSLFLNGTHEQQGFPALFFAETGSGLLEVELPVDLLEAPHPNETFDRMYRLDLLLPDAILIDVHTTTMHPSIVPVNLTRQSHVLFHTGVFVSDDSDTETVHLDFTIDSSQAIGNETALLISMSFSWSFAYNSPAYLFEIETIGTLTPYNASYLQLGHNETYNPLGFPADVYPDFYVLDMEFYDAIENFTTLWPANCTLVTSNGSLVESWHDLSNCTRCVSLGAEAAVYNISFVEFLQPGSNIRCASNVIPIGSVGPDELVEYEINIRHLGDYSSLADELQLTVKLPGHESSFEMEVYDPHANTTFSYNLDNTSSVVLHLFNYSKDDGNIRVGGGIVYDYTVPIGGVQELSFDLVYGSTQSHNGIQNDYQSRCLVQNYVLQYEIENQDFYSIPTPWGYQEPAVVNLTVEMPPGTIYDAVLTLVVMEDGDSDSPLIEVFGDSEITLGAGVTLLTQPAVVAYQNLEITNASNPVRQIIKRRIGNVENVNNDTAYFSVLVLLRPNLQSSTTVVTISMTLEDDKRSHYLASETVTLPFDDVADISGGTYFTLPSIWTILEPATLNFNFTLPQGKLDNCVLKLFDHSSVIELINSEVTVSSGVTVSTPLFLGTSALNSQQTNRRRRAITTLQRVIGAITNPNAADAIINVQIQFRASTATIPGPGLTLSAAFASSALTVNIPPVIVTTIAPQLTMERYIRHPSTGGDTLKKMEVFVNVSHGVNSTSVAYSVTITLLETGFVLPAKSQFTFSGLSTSDVTISGSNRIKAVIPVFNLTDSPIELSFVATALTDADFKSNGYTHISSLEYNSISTGSQVYDNYAVSTCVSREDNVIEVDNVVLQNGLIVLAVIIGLLVGTLLVLLIVYCLGKYLIRSRKVSSFAGYSGYSATDYAAMGRQRQSRALLLDGDQKIREETILRPSQQGSIVALLALNDRFRVNRELDNLDIQATMTMDRKLEAERLLSMQRSMEVLLLSLVKNRDITQSQYDVVIVQFKKDLKSLDDKLSDDNKKAMEEFSKKQALHNRARLGQLIDKQAADKERRIEKAGDMTEAEKAQLIDLIDKECQIEQDNTSYLLKLEQDEEAERLRKEHALKKRLQTKELQTSSLTGLQSKLGLVDEQASWILKEHANNVKALDKIHDEELCRQKLVLEERLANRKALAHISDVQEGHTSELLNTMAGDQIDCVKRAKKLKLLNSAEARDMNSDLIDELKKYNDEVKREMSEHEAQLHKVVSELRKKELEAKEKEHAAALAEFEKSMKGQLNGNVDPISLAQQRLELISKQELDMAALDESLDKEHANQLKNLREKMTQTSIEKLTGKERQLLNNLKEDGMNDAQIQGILKDHQSAVAQLEEHQANVYRQQEETLKARLKKRRKDLEARMEVEKQEKAHLREQENYVINQIVSNQMTMSGEEREKIMKEHEATIVRLENSLTLNKLRQRQMLEKRLNDRRTKKLEDIERKHLSEARRREKEFEDESSAIDLITQQANERLELIVEDDDDIILDDEMEKVRLEVMQERAIALREQEDRLGGMVAQLQLNKAKELAEIDAKQKAINELKTSLVDDLNQRGVMSDTEAEHHLEQHRQQQEKLVSKLENERNKQEKALKQKLAARLQTRENTLLETYDTRLKEVLDQAPNKIAARLKKAAVKHKQMIAMEEFKTNMEKEISQSLDEIRRQHEMKKRKLMQELELRFIASLVQQGKLKRSDIKSALKMLFPAKSENDLENLINTLHNPSENVREDEKDLLNTSSASMLKERIAESMNLLNPTHNSLGRIDESSDQIYSAQRVKSGRRRQPHPLDMGYMPAEPQRSKLPPLTTNSPSTGKRKTSRRLQPIYDDEQDDF